MTPYKNGKIGWDLGIKFKIIGHKKWGNIYVYKVRYRSTNRNGCPYSWYEFKEHFKLKKEKCFSMVSLVNIEDMNYE